MTRFPALAAFALALTLTALTAPAASAQENFTRVRISGNYQVEVYPADDPSVTITGDQAGGVRTRIHGDELQIVPASRGWFGRERRIAAMVRIAMPSLQGVSAERGAEVKVAGFNSGNLDVSVAMGAVLEISGACQHLDASAAMGGQLNAHGLSCASVDASAAMGGSMNVNARDSLDASAAMGGSINVIGAPTRRDVSSTMGGSINVEGS